MSTAYQLTSDKDTITIRLNRGAIDEVSLTKLLDFLEMEAIRRRSQLSEEDAELLAEDVKRAAWERVKHLYEEP